MKKIAAGATLVAAVGFSALSASPAAAVTLPFPNCDTAAAAGVYNIPAISPAYGPHLDRDNDGFGCDETTNPYDAQIVANIVAENQPEPTTPPVDTDEQVVQVPQGPADTGVTPAGDTNTAALALGGGLALTVAAGGTYLVRRRATS